MNKDYRSEMTGKTDSHLLYNLTFSVVLLL